MVIDINNLKIEHEKRNKLITDYEEINLNLYNQLKEVLNYWIDNNALVFKEKLEKEALEIKEFIEKIKSVEEVYQFIIKKYETIGNQIQINLSEKQTVINEFNNYLNHLTQIINKYNALNLTFCPTESMLLKNQRNKLIEDKKQLETVKSKILAYFENIEEIEKEIANKLDKEEINLITENDI